MSRDFALELRQAIITRLRADGGVEHVPSERIYGMRQPSQTAWPFTRYGQPDTTAAGAGESVSVTLHTFSKNAYEDECAQTQSSIVNKLDGAVLTLDDDTKAHVAWRSSQIIPDGAEANAWHGLARFEATIAAC